MKKLLCVIMSFVFAFGMLATVASADEAVVYDGPEMELTFSFSSGTPEQAKIYTDACDRISARTDGKVTFVYYYGGSLASAYEALDAVGNGMCELADISHANFQDRFPYSQQVFALPFMPFSSLVMAADVMNQFIPNNEYCMAEFEAANVHPLFFVGVWGTSFVFRDAVELNGPEDLAGKKIMTTADLDNQFIMDCGGTPVAQPVTEIYSSMQNGVIDGAMMGLYLTNIFGALQLAKSVYMLERSFTTGTRSMCINLDVWNSFTPELQQIFNEEFQSDEMWESAVTYWNTEDAYHLQCCDEWGIPVTYVEGDAMNPYVEKAAPYTEAKLAELQEKNEHTMEVYDALMAAIENYEAR